MKQGSADGFVAFVSGVNPNLNGSHIRFASYLGGSGGDFVQAAFVDETSLNTIRLAVAGGTQSLNFPISQQTLSAAFINGEGFLSLLEMDHIFLEVDAPMLNQVWCDPTSWLFQDGVHIYYDIGAEEVGLLTNGVNIQQSFINSSFINGVEFIDIQLYPNLPIGGIPNHIYAEINTGCSSDVVVNSVYTIPPMVHDVTYGYSPGNTSDLLGQTIPYYNCTGDYFDKTFGIFTDYSYPVILEIDSDLLPPGISYSILPQNPLPHILHLKLYGSFTGAGNYSVPVKIITGNCDYYFYLTFNVSPSCALSHVSGPLNQFICNGSPITPVTFQFNSPPIINFYPNDGSLSATFNGNQITIQGTPSVSTSVNLIPTGYSYQAPYHLYIGVSNTFISYQIPAFSVCPGTPVSYSHTLGLPNSPTITASGLPPGIAVQYNNGQIVFSGTVSNTAVGIYNYTLFVSGGSSCDFSITGTIQVLIGSPGSYNSTYTVCQSPQDASFLVSNGSYTASLNIPLEPNDVVVGNLPDGVFVITTPIPNNPYNPYNSYNTSSAIVGNPTTSGTYPITIMNMSGCSITAVNVTIQVLPRLQFSHPQPYVEICHGNTIPTLSIPVSGATGIGAAQGLPVGVTALFSGGQVIISGTPAHVGDFQYSIPLLGGCGDEVVEGVIKVNGSPSLTLLCNNANNNQAVCINSPVNPISFFYNSYAPNPSVSVSGLPPGMYFNNYASNSNNFSGVVAITGTPTQLGTYNYTVTVTGPCGSVTQGGTLVITQPGSGAPTAALTSSPGSDNQTVCLNSSLTTISYISTGAVMASFSGLPAGVTGNFDSNSGEIVVSGTPSQSGSFTYTITLSGGCQTTVINGSIQVLDVPTYSLSSLPGTNNQTVCLGNAITDIIYTLNGAGSVTVSGLPSGVSYVFSGSSLLITGTPVAQGNYNYVITLSGSCGTTTIPGSIIVTTATTLTLSSAPGTENQTICINTPITNIVYTITGAAGATVTGLPAGIIASYNPSTGVLLISGSSNVTGTHNYTISPTGGCVVPSASGTITINPNNTVTGPFSATVCASVPMTPITRTTTGATGIGTATGLPPGVTASFAGNTIIISGTPTTAGTYFYSIPLTGGCGSLNASGSITVTPANTVGGSANATVCVGTAMTPLYRPTTGATGIGTPSGLPPGVTASFSSGTITISGTPTAAGTYNYTIPLTGGCGNVSATGTITVNPTNTVTGPGSATACLFQPMTTLTHTTTGATGIGSPSGLPPGVMAGFSGNTISISGTPTTTGTFNYTIPLMGGCGNVSATGTITVNPANTVTGPGSATVCVNTALTPITHTTTGATGIGTPSGLPPGVTASFAGNTITLSGTPTATGSYTYTIPLTGGCGNVSATGTIIVNPANTVSGPGSVTVCLNTALSPITHTTTGATGIGTPSGLPPGVTASFAGNTITLSGTPTAVGNYNYSIPLSGGCGNVSATGTIIVNPANTVSGPGSATVCVNTVLTPITHTTTGATGIGTPSGLPPGVTASFAGNTITLSGTPTAAGTYSYTIPLTGGCGNVSATGTITVNPANTVTGPGSATVCVNTAMTPITHTTTGATGIGTPSGLPPGVTASFSSGTITISGTPSASGIYSYTIPLAGGCGSVIATGTITVNPDNTVSGPGSATVCVNTALTPITHTTTGATGIGTPSGLPPGVMAGFSANTISISGTPTATGTFNYTIPLTGGCGNVNATGTITVAPAININTQPPYQACVGSYASWQIPVSNATTVSVTGLPTGLNSAYSSSNQTLYINGTPTTAGTYNVQIQASGGVCSANTTIQISVTPQTSLTLVVQPPTYLPNADNQVVCVGNPINLIRFQKSTGSAFSTSGSLPPGVNFTTSGNFLNISGTPTGGINQTYTFTIIASGPCGVQMKQVKIKVVGYAQPTVVGYSYNPNPSPSQPHIFISRPSGQSMPPLTIILPTCSIPYRSLQCQSILTNPFIPVTIQDNSVNNPLFPNGVSCTVQGTHLVISGTPTGNGIFRFTVNVPTCCGNISIRVHIMLYQQVTFVSSHFAICLDDLRGAVPMPGDSVGEIRRAEVPSWLSYELQEGRVFVRSDAPEEGRYTLSFTTVDAGGRESERKVYLEVSACAEEENMTVGWEESGQTEDPAEMRLFEYFPNPTSDRITIRTSHSGGTLYLYSPEGRIMTVQRMQNERGELDMSAYPAGMYLLRYTTPEGETFSGKVVKVE